MNSRDYISKALRTEPPYHFSTINGLTPRIEHAVYGLVTEAGELMDEVKRTKLYGKELDKTNLLEEAGDIMWYLAVLCDDLQVDFETIWQKNIDKLKVRFPDKFTNKEALERNTIAERKILENK